MQNEDKKSRFEDIFDEQGALVKRIEKGNTEDGAFQYEFDGEGRDLLKVDWDREGNLISKIIYHYADGSDLLGWDVFEENDELAYRFLIKKNGEEMVLCEYDADGALVEESVWEG